uniref:Uncharacterized protein MANES_05G198900 n=1 Tax=Rhizophora mucronata TaxID=61149 RepID=A0A2P2JC03_RHIMU
MLKKSNNSPEVVLGPIPIILKDFQRARGLLVELINQGLETLVLVVALNKKCCVIFCATVLSSDSTLLGNTQRK